MSEIKLSVETENLETVLMILNNLKSGLIREIQTDGKSTKDKPTQYQPKTNTIVKETTGKYLDASAFKERLKAKKSRS